MAQVTVNPFQFDPYKNFEFRVKWDGRYVAGISKVGALERITELVVPDEEGDPATGRSSPGRTKYEAVTLERGLTHDREFECWANKVWHYDPGPGVERSLADFRKDLMIELFNESGQIVISYRFVCAWVSEFVALADLDAKANFVPIQFMKLEHEGWERCPMHEPIETDAGANAALQVGAPPQSLVAHQRSKVRR